MTFRSARSLVVAAAVLAAALATAGASRAEDAPDAWSKGAHWISFRGGYARSLDEDAANGNIGYGVSYGRVVGTHLMLAGSLEHNLLGRFSSSSQIELPASFEMLWHFKWKAPVHPFFGTGFSAVYTKLYRTGADYSDFQPGLFVSGGVHTPIDHNSLLGVYVRVTSVASDAEADNPVFGGFKPSTGRVSAKVAWTRTYW